jgi:hypothetical protein
MNKLDIYPKNEDERFSEGNLALFEAMNSVHEYHLLQQRIDQENWLPSLWDLVGKVYHAGRCHPLPIRSEARAERFMRPDELVSEADIPRKPALSP